MTAKRALRKVVDEVSPVHCVSGPGLIREEVWLNEDGEVGRYNLAFINHFLTRADHGRVLGYDNSHDRHHRHFKGVSELFEYLDYETLRERFIHEVRELRKEQP